MTKRIELPPDWKENGIATQVAKIGPLSYGVVVTNSAPGDDGITLVEFYLLSQMNIQPTSTAEVNRQGIGQIVSGPMAKN